MLGVLVSLINDTPTSSVHPPPYFYHNMDLRSCWGVQRHFGEPSPDPNQPGARIVTDKPCVDPNFLVYNDGLAPQKISIPEGEFDDVMDIYLRMDFGALSGYETFGGDGVERLQE